MSPWERRRVHAWPLSFHPRLRICWNSFTYLAALSILHDLRACRETRAGLTKSHAAWLKNDSPGIVGYTPTSSPRWIPWILKRTLWIQRRLCWEQSRNMAGWLCTVGVGNILIHVCISACAVLYIHLMNLQLPSRQTSEEKSHRFRTPVHIHNILLRVCSCTVCYLIFFLVGSRHVCIIVGLHMLHVASVNNSKSMQSL